MQSRKAIIMGLMVISAWLLSPPLGGTEVDVDALKVVYHLDDARNGRFALHLAADHLEINPAASITVVAYANGVDFLLEDARDRKDQLYAPAVQTLMGKGVQFRVCSATLGFRDIDKSQVLEGISLVPSGTYEIVRLQSEEGYVYLKP